jgi:hypothetical protein
VLRHHRHELEDVLQPGPRPLGLLIGPQLLQGGGSGRLLVVVVEDDCLQLHSGRRRHVLHLLLVVVLAVFLLVLLLTIRGGLAGLEILLTTDRPAFLMLLGKESGPEVLPLVDWLVPLRGWKPLNAAAHLLA